MVIYFNLCDDLIHKRKLSEIVIQEIQCFASITKMAHVFFENEKTDFNRFAKPETIQADKPNSSRVNKNAVGTDEGSFNPPPYGKP